MLDKLRIGLFSWESMHSIRVGGISPHVTGLAETLASKGHEVHVFTRSGWMREYDLINGVHYQRCPRGGSGEGYNNIMEMCDGFAERFYCVERMFGKFDILHAHDWHPVNALYRIKKERGYPFIMTFHSSEFGRNGNQDLGACGSHEITHLEWLGGFESAGIITVSEHMKEELWQIYNIPGDKVTVIPNGVDDMKKKVNKRSIRDKYSLHSLLPIILFVGRMAYQKGPDLLVRSAAVMRQKDRFAEFVFVGGGEMLQDCINLADSIGVSNQCRFLGYVDEREKVDLLNACNIFCAPSRNEPFGITVIEAWSASKPVVGTNAIGIIDNNVNGMKAALHPVSISRCITTLIEQPDTRNRMGRNGKKKVESEYGWESICERTLKAYDNLIHG